MLVNKSEISVDCKLEMCLLFFSLITSVLFYFLGYVSVCSTLVGFNLQLHLTLASWLVA